jgi:hypothetical protein
MKALVAGWFSFEQMGATAGDLFARDLVCQWLREANITYDVALAAPFDGGIPWDQADPQAYSHVVFVCGPFGNGRPITEFLPRFAASRLVGINLTMLEPLEAWNPFDLLLERDSSRFARPDITFLSQQPKVPVVGVVLVHPQKEYGGKARHHEANEAVARLLSSREVAAVPIDTCLDGNTTGLRTPREVESLIARMDVVVTTRLHGTVLALKNGVPVVAIDPIAGGAKVKRQTETIGWPIVLTADALSDEKLHEAFRNCLTEEARRQAHAIGDSARLLLKNLRADFVREFDIVQNSERQ